MDPWTIEVYAITLFVEELETTTDFYQRVFGFPAVFGDDNCKVFKFGNVLINLLKISEANELIDPATVGAPDVGSRMVFTLPVDDVDATCSELLARGVSLLNGPMDRPWGIRTASFKDPAGYIWEIAK
jgi:lactoylglutathione lyase